MYYVLHCYTQNHKSVKQLKENMLNDRHINCISNVNDPLLIAGFQDVQRWSFHHHNNNDLALKELRISR